MNIYAENILKHDEGYRRFPYKDTEGVLTVGYGLNLESEGMDEPTAAFNLSRQITNREALISNSQPLFLTLSPVRQAAIIGMTYQLGIKGTLAFKTMWSCIEFEDFIGAADAMIDSKWAKQTPDRAYRMAYLMKFNKIPAYYSTVVKSE